MRLIHTLLLLFRENRLPEDRAMAGACLKSLEAGAYKTVVVYNQGCLSNGEAEEFLKGFGLDAVVLGRGTNVGTAVGRQSCFEHIWRHFPDTEYVSELHPDMILAPRWEEPLIEYLGGHDEPMVSCGIVDSRGLLPFCSRSAVLPASYDLFGDFLLGLKRDEIVYGFTNPCVHVSGILKQTGGYNPLFLRDLQCYEDDSMLLGYYYYYGTRAAWRPKINYNSVVYHAVAAQRWDMGGNVRVNFNGLVRQYGAMGLKALSELHESEWHRAFFAGKYNEMAEG